MSNERERKSVGEQETFEVDTRDTAFVPERARALAHTVWSRLEGEPARGPWLSRVPDGHGDRPL